MDYKFFCFDGEPKYCQVIVDRSSEEKIDFYDMNWVRQPFVGLTPLVKNAPYEIASPRSFSKMKEWAQVLAKNIPFARIDFYEINSHPYFGEITFYPAAGFGEFSPDRWNKILGDMIKISISS